MKARAWDICGLSVDIGRQMERRDTLRRIITSAADHGYNTIFLYAEGALEYRSHPQISSKVHLTQAEYQSLQALATDKGVDLPLVIPGFGHTRYITRAMPELDELAGGRVGYMRGTKPQICISNPKSYDVMHDLLSEWAANSTSPYLHVGGDESWQVGVCPRCRERADRDGVGALVIDHLNRLNDLVKRLGKRCIIWADMLLYYDVKDLERLSRDIVLMDWNYGEIRPYPRVPIYYHRAVSSLDLFLGLGFEVIICPRATAEYNVNTKNIASMRRYAEKYPVKGMVVTTWELRAHAWDLLTPAVDYGAAACGEDVPDRFAFLEAWAREHFASDPDIAMQVVDLTGRCTKVGGLTDPMDALKYDDDPMETEQILQCRRGLRLCEAIQPKTPQGTRYLQDAKLEITRASWRLRTCWAVNALASTLVRGKVVEAQQLLGEIDDILAATPELVAMNRAVWDRDRYPDDPQATDGLLRGEATRLREFADACREVIAGGRSAADVFPEVLELRMLNYQPAWQYLQIEVADEPGRWEKAFEDVKCVYLTPRDQTFVKLPSRNMRYVRITLSGFGDLGLMYAQIWHPGGRRIPQRIIDHSENVRHPEHLLHDDYCVTGMGTVETARYFRKGVGQPEMSITIELGADLQYRAG